MGFQPSSAADPCVPDVPLLFMFFSHAVYFSSSSDDEFEMCK